MSLKTLKSLSFDRVTCLNKVKTLELELEEKDPAGDISIIPRAIGGGVILNISTGENSGIDLDPIQALWVSDTLAKMARELL